VAHELWGLPVWFLGRHTIPILTWVPSFIFSNCRRCFPQTWAFPSHACSPIGPCRIFEEDPLQISRVLSLCGFLLAAILSYELQSPLSPQIPSPISLAQSLLNSSGVSSPGAMVGKLTQGSELRQSENPSCLFLVSQRSLSLLTNAWCLKNHCFLYFSRLFYCCYYSALKGGKSGPCYSILASWLEVGVPQV